MLATAETVLATGNRSITEDRMRTSAGLDVSVSCNLMPISLRGRQHLVVMFENLTQRRQLEAQLRVAQRMEAIGQLAAGVAHDFNNLLTVIGTYTTLMVEETPDTDARKEDLLEIMGATTRGAALTRQLLAFGRRQMLEAKVFDLNDVVAGLEKMFRRLLSAEIELEIILSRGPSSVNADLGQIEQVLMNLVVNARDAMPGGGRLTIATKSVDADMNSLQPAIRSGDYAAGLVMLSVTDTGTGMDADTLSRAFEPFFSTKAGGRGTGLGLSTSYGIIKQSGGHIRSTSVVGAGTTFEVLLPRVVAAAEQAVQAEVADAELYGAEMILMAEDDPSVRRIIVSTLRRYGYNVLEATDGQRAHDMSFESGARPALLLTDVVMPGMSGRTLAKALRVRWPGLPVLFTSAYASDLETGESVSNLPGLLLRKPFVPVELATAVRRALRTGRPG